MRWPAILLIPLLLAGLLLPACAIEGNKMGYVTFEQVRIRLTNGDARVEVDYSLDPGMGVIILLFGAGDLQRKIERALNYPSPRVEEVGLGHAVLIVDGAAENYGDRAYWFPAHSFGVIFPQAEVAADGYSISYDRTRSIPRGFGYFGDMP